MPSMMGTVLRHNLWLTFYGRALTLFRSCDTLPCSLVSSTDSLTREVLQQLQKRHMSNMNTSKKSRQFRKRKLHGQRSSCLNRRRQQVATVRISIGSFGEEVKVAAWHLVTKLSRCSMLMTFSCSHYRSRRQELRPGSLFKCGVGRGYMI